MLPVSTTRQRALTPPQPSPFRRGPCAWEQRSLGEALGPAPGNPELLSVSNADSHSTRVSVEAGPDFPEEAWVPVDTNPGLPETQIEETVRTGVSEETQVTSV